jgi:hypothetical protein
MDCAALKNVNTPTIMISFLMPTGLNHRSVTGRRARRRHVIIRLFPTIISSTVREQARNSLRGNALT